MLSGWFSFNEYNPLMNMEWHNQLDPRLIPGWVPIRGNFFTITANNFQTIFNEIYKIPFFTVFLSYVFYAALVPGFLTISVFRKHRRGDIQYWLIFIPMISSIVLGCWLAPVSVHFEGRRYLYPIVYTLPLLISWSLFIYKHESEENID